MSFKNPSAEYHASVIVSDIPKYTNCITFFIENDRFKLNKDRGINNTAHKTRKLSDRFTLDVD